MANAGVMNPDCSLRQEDGQESLQLAMQKSQNRPK